MSETNGRLPHWDLTVVYPDLETAEFEQGFQDTIQAIQDLTALFDRHGINRLDDAPAVTVDVVDTFEAITDRFNQVVERMITLNAYLQGHLATNSRNEAAQARYSELQPYLARLSLLRTRLTAWLGSLDVDTLIAQSDVARNHAFTLRQADKAAVHLMSPAEEALASDMQLTGSSAWYRMFNDLTSQLTVTVELDGETKKMPLTAAQNLAYHPDRDVRRHAHEQVQQTLGDATVSLAAALNSVKGETLTLADKRGWDDPLDAVLFENAIDRSTLEAMMGATRAAFPDFQRYLKARARALGVSVLANYDRLVPLGEGSTSWSFDEAADFILKQFGAYSSRLQQMARRAFSESWIDAEPRDGKRGGAFCMWLQHGESRILSNFEPSFTAVSTLAHELGHAYHNLNLAGRTVLQRDMPMTLAETASTFCQKIVENAALKTADDRDALIILDGGLEYATRVVLNASSDFAFESRLFEKRRRRALSADELTELSRSVQQEVFADALDPDTIQHYRWVYVPHYYVTSFYNFPYIFGLLFGLGLYAYYQDDPEAFKDGYDDLLSRTGMDEAAELAAQFGIDIHQPSFWEASLDVLRADIDRVEDLVERRLRKSQRLL